MIEPKCVREERLTEWVKAQRDHYATLGAAGALVAAKIEELLNELAVLGRPANLAAYLDRSETMEMRGPR